MSFAKLVLTKDGISLDCNQVDGQLFTGMFTKKLSEFSTCNSLMLKFSCDCFYGVQVHTDKTDSHFLKTLRRIPGNGTSQCDVYHRETEGAFSYRFTMKHNQEDLQNFYSKGAMPASSLEENQNKPMLVQRRR